MVTSEAEKSTERHRYTDGLLLISPELARRYGIPADAPVFISPSLGKNGLLAYQTGGVVRRQNTGEGSVTIDLGEGGWYSGPPPIKEYIDEIKIREGLVFSGYAILQLESDKNLENFRIEKIYVYCSCANCNRELIRLPLTEGFIVSANNNPGVFSAVCSFGYSQAMQQGERARFNFRATDTGEVLFSQLEQDI